MNLLFVTETYPPEINGVARTLAEMVNGLQRRGHRVILVRPAQKAHQDPEAPEETAVEQVEMRGAPLPGYPGLRFGFPNYRRINRLIRQHRFDAAYIATEGPLGHSALRACRRFRVPALSGLHTNFHQYSAHYGAGLFRSLTLNYLLRFHNRANGTLVPTRSMARELTGLGFSNVTAWPRGVHTTLFDPRHRDPDLRSEWGLIDGQLAVLYVGRLAPEKNIDVAFAAFRAISDRQPDARFVLVGGGPCAARLRQQHADAIFVGSKIGQDLARHYASADMFLFPSKTETFGNVTLEAMASGLAVVAYELAAAKELIESGSNGVLAHADSADAFVERAVQCASDHGLRSSVARQARATALRQDWPKLLERLEALFADLSRSRRGGDIGQATESTERL